MKKRSMKKVKKILRRLPFRLCQWLLVLGNRLEERNQELRQRREILKIMFKWQISEFRRLTKI